MPDKKDIPFLFEVQLNWLSDKKGILSAKDASGALPVETASEFGGDRRHWTPEHLFLGSISSCFMTTYLAFAQKLGFEISDLDCDITGLLGIVDGRLKFTHINLYPKVIIANEDIREKAILALEKTQKNCLVANSVNAFIFYNSEIVTNTAKAVKKDPIHLENKLSKSTKPVYDHASA